MQVSSSDRMEELASRSFLGVTKERGLGLSATTSSVERALNSCSRVRVEIGMVYGCWLLVAGCWLLVLDEVTVLFVVCCVVDVVEVV